MPADAVAALLLLKDDRYLMQLRDDIPNIFYPAHWGCFGGAIEHGETPEQELKRELLEELELDVGESRLFTRFNFDFAPLGHSVVTRIYFEVDVLDSTFENFVLHEVADFRAIKGSELISSYKVIPYDAFAVWMHMAQRDLVGRASNKDVGQLT